MSLLEEIKKLEHLFLMWPQSYKIQVYLNLPPSFSGFVSYIPQQQYSNLAFLSFPLPLTLF